jgi:hypothetical protein
LVFSWYARYFACSIHIFLAFFHYLLLFGLIPLLCLLFLIFYFKLAPLCSPSFRLWYLFWVLSCLFWIIFQGFHILLISSFIFWIVFLISFMFVCILWDHLIVYSLPFLDKILTFMFLLWGH